MKKIYTFLLTVILTCTFILPAQAQTKAMQDATRKAKLLRLQKSGKVMQEIAHDISMISIDQPFSAYALTAYETVVITIQNMGSEDESNIPVYYSVDNGTPVNEVVNGSLNSGDFTSYSFMQTADLSLLGSHTIKAWSGLAGDLDNSNDTLEITVTNQSYYCTPGSLLCDEYIAEVTMITSVVNLTNSSNCSTGGYEDYSSMIGTFNQGDNVVMEIINGNPVAGSLCGVWIDWNQNDDFTDDDPIIVLEGADTFNAFFQVPGWVTGNLRMRVKITASAFPDPCTIDATGETEDYTLEIVGTAGVDDIAITQLLSPVSVTNLPVNYFPSVEITNYGPNPVTNFPVSYQVNGGAAVIETFTGTIDPGISAIFTFNQAYNMPICNAFHFLIYTSMAGDVNLYNDTISAIVDATYYLNVTAGGNFQQIVQSILPGNGIAISNITYVGDTNALGKFQAHCTTFGVDSGLIIATGYVTTAIGPNNSGSEGMSLDLVGDTQLDGLVGETTYDAAVLEFDLVPQYDTILFRYVFGSEEYPEWVNQYNDVFAFFVSGPNPSGEPYVNYNIAVVPGTTNTVVSVDNINNGVDNTGPCVNCQYYVHNMGNELQLDAYTTPLLAFFTAVPGATYHLKIAIADTRDHVYDSDVFLEAGSFSSPSGNTSISGEVEYHNTAETPLANTTVFLKQNNQIIQQSNTNTYGHYQFNNVPAGNYTIETTSSLPWGGGNSVDALLILKHFVGIELLHDLPLLAADANGDHSVNSIDALTVVKRFVGIITSFPSGSDWVFDTPDIIFNGNTPVVQNIEGLCIGDVNRSHTP